MFSDNDMPRLAELDSFFDSLIYKHLRSCTELRRD